MKKRKKKALNIYLEPQIIDALKKYADSIDKKPSAIIREYIQNDPNIHIEEPSKNKNYETIALFDEKELSQNENN